jgi:hypothetical protein
MNQHKEIARLRTTTSWLIGILGVALLFLNVLLSACTLKADQKEIWYVGRLGIRAIDPFTQKQRSIVQKDFTIEVAFSSDGQHIAFVMPRGELRYSIGLANANGSNIRKIIADYYLVDFLWLDNEHLVVMTIDERWKRPDQGDWFLYHIPTQQLRQVQPPSDMAITCRLNRASIYANHLPIVSSPPTLPLTFWELQDGVVRLVGDATDVVALGHLEVNGNVLQLVTNVPIPPGDVFCDSWTPDGERAAIRRRTAYHAEDIFLVTNQGRRRKQLTEFWRTYEGGASIGTLSISPDGRWIIFQAHLYQPRVPGLVAGKNLLLLLNADDGRLEFLGEQKLYGHFVWSPDSRQVAASLSPRGAAPDKGGEVHIIDVAMRKVTQLTFDGGFKEVFDWR